VVKSLYWLYFPVKSQETRDPKDKILPDPLQ